MSNTTIITFAILVIIACACKKKPDAAPALSFRLSTEGLQYVRLTPQKFFIYKDSANNSTDSVVVTLSLLGSQHVPERRDALSFYNHPAYDIETFSLVLTKKSSRPDSVWLSASTMQPLLPAASSGEIGFELRHSNNQVFFSYPGSQVGPMTVEGKIYNEVIKTSVFSGGTPADSYYLRMAIYWAKNIGVIRLEIENSTRKNVYTLLRNN